MLVPADTPPPSGKSPAKRPRPSTGPDEAMELSSSFRDQQSQERNMDSWSPASLVEVMSRKAPLVDMPHLQIQMAINATGGDANGPAPAEAVECM